MKRKITTNLATFVVNNDLPILDYVIDICNQLDCDVEYTTTKRSPKIKFIIEPRYDDKKKELFVTVDIEKFTPQIQVIDDGVSVNKKTIRYSGLIWNKNGKCSYSHMAIMLASITGSMEMILNKLGFELKKPFPDYLENLKANVDGPDNRMDIIKCLQKTIKHPPQYDDEWIYWISQLGTGGRRVHSGIDQLFRSIAIWSTNIFEKPEKDNFVDDIIHAWLTPETYIWKKRLRFIEHMLIGLRYKLIDLYLKVSGKQSGTHNMSESWYQSGLFIYNTCSNLLGLIATKTRTTLKGVDGFKEVPIELRLMNDSLIDLNLCPIDTGDRENAGVVHYYTDTIIKEYVYHRPTVAQTLATCCTNIGNPDNLASFSKQLSGLFKKIYEYGKQLIK